MSQGKRYKFNGSTFQVQTALTGSSPSPIITGISRADPGVVTSTNTHADGDVIRIKGVLGMTEVNNRLYVVDNRAAGSYELADEDTSMNNVYVSGGYTDEVVFSQFCELTGLNQQGGAADEIEVSTICSTKKEFEQGLSDSGTLTLDFNWAGLETVQAAMAAANESGDQLAFKVVMPNSGGTIIMIGTVQSMSFSGSVNGVYTASATIKLTGNMFTLA